MYIVWMASVFIASPVPSQKLALLGHGHQAEASTVPGTSGCSGCSASKAPQPRPGAAAAFSKNPPAVAGCGPRSQRCKELSLTKVKVLER